MSVSSSPNTQVVSAFEGKLLRLLAAILDQAPALQTPAGVDKTRSAPQGLSPSAIQLVEQMLSRGLTKFLARAGGWRRERFLGATGPSEGRLWQRNSPTELGLEFSPHTIELLIWFTNSGHRDGWPLVSPAQMTNGDMVVQFMITRFLVSTNAPAKILKSKLIGRNPLIAICYPQFSSSSPSVPDFVGLISNNAWLLECLHDEMAINWQRLEEEKRTISLPSQMRRLGEAQSLVIDHFLQAADRLGRRDLARFLLQTGTELLHENVSHEDWIGSLRYKNLRMEERQLVNRAALSFLQRFRQLQDWQRQALSVSYFDEEYSQSQLWKLDWEIYNGDELCRHAERLIAAADPLQSAEPREATGAQPDLGGVNE